MGNSTTTRRKGEASRDLRPHSMENHAGEHWNSYRLTVTDLGRVVLIPSLKLKYWPNLSTC